MILCIAMLLHWREFYFETIVVFQFNKTVVCTLQVKNSRLFPKEALFTIQPMNLIGSIPTTVDNWVWNLRVKNNFNSFPSFGLLCVSVTSHHKSHHYCTVPYVLLHFTLDVPVGEAP